MKYIVDRYSLRMCTLTATCRVKPPLPPIGLHTQIYQSSCTPSAVCVCVSLSLSFFLYLSLPPSPSLPLCVPLPLSL